MLEELEHLSQLRWLEMIKLERVALYTTGSVLADKKYLQVLNLSCTEHTDVPYSEEDVSITEKVLDQLIPPRNLEDLLINGFFGWRYQTCLGSTHLSSLKHLKLVNCKSCMHLPPIGQLDNLKYLKIVGAAKVTKIGPEFVGCRGANPRSMVTVAFPKLELLVIKNLHNWEEWSFVEEEDAAGAAATEGSEDGDAEMRKGEALSPKLHLLPQLKKLELGGCPKLRALPRHLGQHATSFRELHLRGASCLKVVEDLQFLSENLLIAGCDGLERVSNLPQLRELRLHDSLNLRHVEGLSGLQQLWLTKNMCDASLVWVAGLQEQHRELHGEAVDVYTWPEC